MATNLANKTDFLFENFNLKCPDPKKNHPWNLEHLHADFIELQVLFWDKDSYLTLQDSINFYQDLGYQIDFEEDKTLSDTPSSQNAEIQDRWKTKFTNFFYLIEERYLLYDEDYPFEVKNLKLKLKENLSDSQKLYLSLLISSNLNNFSKVQDILTSEFETISKYTLEEYFPSMTVEEFGQNSTYVGNTFSKITALSEKLRISVRTQELSNIPKTANKEKGLDIIGWKFFEDRIASKIIILGQCACGKDWPKKKGDTMSYQDSYLDFHKLLPIHAMFIPYGLVNLSSSFFQSEITNGRLIFERKRITELMKNKLAEFKALQSYTIVEKCIEFQSYEV